MTKATEEPLDKKPAKKRNVFFWLGRLFLMLLVFFFVIILMIQLPPVQMMGARFISKKIATSLNSTVRIGGFNLHPVSDLSLTDVFISSPDHKEDTLINAGTISVDFNRLWDLLYNKLTINQVVLEDAFLNIEKKAGDTLTNLDLAMLRLLPEKDTSKAAFVFDLEKLSASLLRVHINDHTVGSLVNLSFDRADIAIDTLDMQGQYIKSDYMDFDKPLIYITQKIVEPLMRSAVVKEDKSWSFDIGQLNWTDGKFIINNERKPHDTSQVYGIDYAHLVIADLDIEADSISIRGLSHIRAKNPEIHILHQNGFEIETAAASEAMVSPAGIDLRDLELKTKESHIRNSIAVKFNGFDDFKSFADSVVFVAPQADIKLHFNDLLALAPGLGKVNFIADNKDKTLILKGDINGHLNRLRILEMDGSLGGITMTGDFRSRDLAVKGSQLLSLDLDRAALSANDLRAIFPRMKIPAQLNRLGKVNFTGKFDGYPDDFVAYGKFNTALGGMTMDMNLNIVRGIENARYSGTISLDNFDVGRFIDAPDIGRTSLTGRVIEGRGLTLETINADITAVMSYVVFRGYTYRNARLDGQIQGKQFNGTMDINDPNVDMHFEGTVDLTGKSPRLDFISRIDSIRFLPLGFGDKPLAVSGIFDVNLTSGTMEDFTGSIQGEKVIVTINGINYPLDSLYVDAVIDSISGDRFYNVRSNVASGVLSGVFDPISLPNQINQYLHTHYPDAVGPPAKPVIIDPDVRVAWDIRIHDSGPWLDMVGVPGLVIKNAYTHGALNLRDEKITGFITLPEMHYANFNIYGSSVNFDENKGTVTGDLEVIAADMNESLFFEDVIISGTGTDDSLKVRIRTDHIAEIIDELDVEITADPDDGAWAFSINPISLQMLGEHWMIPPGNIIEIGRKEINLEKFELVSGDKRVVVNDLNNKGIEAFITGFDISYLNSLWVTDKFEFTGTYTLDLEVDNIYDIQKLKTVLHVPALSINNIPYGEWILNAGMDDPKDSVHIDLVMNNNETNLTATGTFLPPIKSIPKEKHNLLNLDVVTTEFPLDFLEFLLGGNIRDTEGAVDLSLNLSGKANRLVPNGTGKVYNGSTTIDYLGTAYSFHDQSFSITPSMIDLTGTKLYDVQGNVATVTGGLTHRYLKDLGLNATINSDKILGLDVSSEENSNFYGVGIGSVNARFSGTVANPSMDIDLTTMAGTHLSIPLSGDVSAEGNDFVIFLENGKIPVDRKIPFNLGGINLNMNLNITDDAFVEIVFDDNTGEKLRARGEGALRIEMTRTGNLSMFGSYIISEGDYMFTNFRVVRKPFELVSGSTIRWDGSPYDAELNVQAKYIGLTAPVFPLIQEFLIGVGTDANVFDAAKERTEVDLTMTLTGSLQHPNIAFDIEFPSLPSDVRAYVETKINSLKANPNAMLQQVVGLLAFRTFLPAESSFATGLSKGIDATLSELISSSLSSYLSGLLGDLIPEGKVLSGISLELGVNLAVTPEDILDNEGVESINSNEVNVVLPLQFFDDRLSVTLGGNYVSGAFTESGQAFAGDVTFEYELTPDGRLRIRAYNRNNETFEGRKNKVGLGLAYRREYDSISEFFGRKRNRKNDKTNGAGEGE